MHLKLNLNGSVDPFVNYLKNFAKIRPSLLIETDTKKRAFVAKTFSEDKAAVRFSAISFDSCNMTIVEHDGEKELGDNRIKTAIILQLPKFIRMIERFGADVDDKGNANFDVDIAYDVLTQDSVEDYVTTSISFTSKTLKMKLDGFRVSELKYLPDEVFNNVVFNVQDPATFRATAATISSIIKTSDIIKIDPKKDSLTFYVDGTDVYVKDHVGKGKQPNFVFKIGELAAPVDYAISATIFREKFIQMMDKVDEDFNVILGHRQDASGNWVVDRILFDSLGTSTKVVISIINEG